VRCSPFQCDARHLEPRHVPSVAGQPHGVGPLHSACTSEESVLCQWVTGPFSLPCFSLRSAGPGADRRLRDFSRSRVPLP
jgi:hypothetical protein